MPLPPPTLPPAASASELTVLLGWSAPVDLDLYLTDPTSETVYFANSPSRSGARLLTDARCPDAAKPSDPLIEAASMPEPLPGRYRVGVDFIDACGAPAGPVTFRVVVDYGGARREAIGTIQLEHFQPTVLEFELQRSPADGALALAAPQ